MFSMGSIKNGFWIGLFIGHFCGWAGVALDLHPCWQAGEGLGPAILDVDYLNLAGSYFQHIFSPSGNSATQTATLNPSALVYLGDGKIGCLLHHRPQQSVHLLRRLLHVWRLAQGDVIVQLHEGRWPCHSPDRIWFTDTQNRFYFIVKRLKHAFLMHFQCLFNCPKTAKTVGIMECLKMVFGSQFHQPTCWWKWVGGTNP